jgi:hypothetical protein
MMLVVKGKEEKQKKNGDCGNHDKERGSPTGMQELLPFAFFQR